MGVGAGLVASALSAFLFIKLAGGFTGRAEEIFEGIAMLFGALLLTTVILWMMNQKHVARELKEKVSFEIKQKQKFGLFMLAFILILREGVETVIFLGAAAFITAGNRILGGILGVATAVCLGYLIFVASVKVDIKKFFNISSFLLLLFVAGLTSYSVHELQEANILPFYMQVWNINPPAPLAEQGIYPAFHENGLIGSIGKGLFGYNGNPSLLETVSYVLYILIIVMAYRKIKPA